MTKNMTDKRAEGSSLCSLPLFLSAVFTGHQQLNISASSYLSFIKSNVLVMIIPTILYFVNLLNKRQIIKSRLQLNVYQVGEDIRKSMCNCTVGDFKI
jgi:hypothetical protein